MVYNHVHTPRYLDYSVKRFCQLPLKEGHAGLLDFLRGATTRNSDLATPNKVMDETKKLRTEGVTFRCPHKNKTPKRIFSNKAKNRCN